MNSIIRQLGLLCLGALAAALTACPSNSVSQCEATGVLCPSGMHCAAAQPICISDTIRCGDAHMDADEECDDGNNIDGDGCSHLCTIEVCGNKRIDPHEECDDGNTVDGDGCSHNCTVERCGNGIKDFGEVCDDGNTKDGDGCSHDCKSTEICGNSKVDTAVGEICDDGNTIDGDGCSADCRSGEGCGNGIRELGEECDDGNKDNEDDCRNDCVVNRCGDGVINKNGGGEGHLEHVEECDDAPLAAKDSRSLTPTETQNCNVDCTKAKCGDGKVNHAFTPSGASGPEQCDVVDGAGHSLDDDHADCTAHCQFSVCGDGLHNTLGPKHAEGCDDGNKIDFDGCSNACTLPSCGNGIVDEGEECDDHNTDNNDDCRNDCVINRCGDGVRNTNGTHTEACESATVQPANSRALTSPESQTCNNDCTAPSCGDGKVNKHFTPLGGTGPEQCDVVDGSGNSLDNDHADCTAHCQINVCGDALPDTLGPNHIEACDDGNKIDFDGCSNACTQPSCGNGIVDEGEECDDHNTDNNDDCRNDCVINRCGDGVRNTNGTHTEACESATIQPANSHALTSPESQTCNNDCTAPSCGDGKVNKHFTPLGAARPEQCDMISPAGLSLNADNADCTAHCQINVCGDGLFDTVGPNHVEPCDDGNRIDADGCSNACTLPFCGNGIVDKDEPCDDGNGINGDTCENDCTRPGCGNGIVDQGEQCDDGNNSNDDDCLNTCRYATCNDGFLRTVTTPLPPPPSTTVVEACDGTLGTIPCTWHQAPQACNTCSAVCALVPQQAPFCGDGNVDDPFETCDSRNTTCGACSGNCQKVTLSQAEGFIFAAAGHELNQNTANPNDTFTLSDGFGHTTVFEFSLTTVTTPTNILVKFADGDANSKVAATMLAAIQGAATGDQFTVQRAGAILTLTSARSSSFANGTTGDTRISESVGSPNFGVIDMAGGQGGNCLDLSPCRIDDDCKSDHCVAATHVCGP